MSQIYNSATSDVPPKTIKIGVGGNNYEDVYFGNKYTHENGVVSKTELVIYNNADRDGAIVIGDIRENGTIDFNDVAKTKRVGNSDLSWRDISTNQKKYLEKEIKKISNNENTWEALGVNTDKEKLDNFLKKNGIKIDILGNVNTLPKKIKSLTLVGIYADYLQFSKYNSIKDLRSCDIQKEFIQDLDNLKLAAYFEKGSCSKFI